MLSGELIFVQKASMFVDYLVFFFGGGEGGVVRVIFGEKFIF